MIICDQDAEISGFLLQMSIVVLDSQQGYLMLQVTNFKIKGVTTNPEPQILKKIDLLKT